MSRANPVSPPMPFVCSLLDDDFELTALSGGGEMLVRIPIGFCSESNNTYSLVTVLSSPPGGQFEHAFFIAEYDTSGDEIYSYFEGSKTNFISDKNHRALVLDALIVATDFLIEKGAPHLVTFMTYEANLPAKALRKYQVIRNCYRRAGYVCGRADPYHGRQIWIAKRPS